VRGKSRVWFEDLWREAAGGRKMRQHLTLRQLPQALYRPLEFSVLTNKLNGNHDCHRTSRRTPGDSLTR